MAAVTSVSDDIARHHCAILQRSSELCAERERAAVTRLTKLASGSPPTAPPEEPAVPDQPAPEPSPGRLTGLPGALLLRGRVQRPERLP